ncbi:16294_t:CDS:1, partial [Rhizophagus irregularis]
KSDSGLEVDVTVKERIKLEKEEVRILRKSQGSREEKGTRHEFISQKCQRAVYKPYAHVM